MGRLITVIFVALALTGLTAAGAFASVMGLGLVENLKQPVSIRQGSHAGARAGTRFMYFGPHHRSHYGGGFRGGK